MIELVSDVFEWHKEMRDAPDDSFDRGPGWCQDVLEHDYRNLFAWYERRR
jgi:hypothetical protein